MSLYPDGDPESSITVKRLRAALGPAVLGAADHRGDLSLGVAREQAIPALRLLRDDPEMRYDMLVDVCGVDWLGREPRFDVVYHLYSVPLRHRVRIKVGVPEDDAVVESATGVWKGAYWFERECYDLLGIRFRNHPFLRRLLLHDEFEGHPLRKDYDQGQRWRCTRVSDLESTVEVPGPAESGR